MWKKIILTKDNLAKRGWSANKHCHFCWHDETVDHLLFQCSFVKLIWQIVVCALGMVRSPDGATNLVEGWLNMFSVEVHQFAGLSKKRNNACFNRKFPNDHALRYIDYVICLNA